MPEYCLKTIAKRSVNDNDKKQAAFWAVLIKQHKNVFGNGVAFGLCRFSVLQVIHQRRGKYSHKVIGNINLLFPIPL